MAPKQKHNIFIQSKALPPSRETIAAASFDGGGVRGVAGTIVVQRIQDELHKLGKTDFSWHTHFHILAGTSTGGLLALLLGRLRVPGEDTTQIYDTLSRSLFKVPSAKKWLHMAGRGAFFSASRFESGVHNIVQDKASSTDDGMLYDPRKDRLPVCVIAVKTRRLNLAHLLLRRHKPHILRSYEPQDKVTTIVAAARATSAAPTYFPAHKLKEGGVLVDGGLGHNNPAKLLIDEAMNVYGYGVRFAPLLSVGTGTREKEGRQGLVGRLTDASKTHDEVSEQFIKKKLGVYVRINVPGIGDIHLDDYKAIPNIIKRTKEHLDSEQGKALIAIAVQAILASMSETETDVLPQN